jgi:hypothetical protein
MKKLLLLLFLIPNLVMAETWSCKYDVYSVDLMASKIDIDRQEEFSYKRMGSYFYGGMSSINMEIVFEDDKYINLGLFLGDLIYTIIFNKQNDTFTNGVIETNDNSFSKLTKPTFGNCIVSE